MIAAGGVRVDGEPAARGLRAHPGRTELIEAVAVDRYVSRSAHKLIAALDALPGAGRWSLPPSMSERQPAASARCCWSAARRR